MMTQSKLIEILFPGSRRLILTAMFRDPNRWWSLPELAGRAGLKPGTLRRHLTQMRDAGLVRERSEGGRASFQPDVECPVHADLQSLIGKMAGADDNTETILVIEDQAATAKITRILLESWGYRVFEAHSGADALALFDGHAGKIDLLLVDVIMPEMSGPEIAEELLRRNPDLRVVFMSGYPASHLEKRNSAFLPKPFNPAGLSRMVRRELDRTRRVEKPMNTSEH